MALYTSETVFCVYRELFDNFQIYRMSELIYCCLSPVLSDLISM